MSDSIASIGKFTRYCNNIHQKYDTATTYIIITGDFSKSDNADCRQSEIKIVQKIIKTKLKGFTVFTCPGNHDFSKGISKYNGKNETQFNEIFYGNTVKNYPDTITKNKFLFIGLNSMYKTEKRSLIKLGLGKIGHLQRKELRTILKHKDFKHHTKIVYMHHAVYNKCFSFHIKRFQLITDFIFVKGIIKNADVFFNGHRHKQLIKTKGKLQIIESLDLQNEKTKGYNVISFPLNK